MSTNWRILGVVCFNVTAGLGAVLLAFDHPKIALWCGISYFLLVCALDMIKDILRVLVGEKVYYLRVWKRFQERQS